MTCEILTYEIYKEMCHEGGDCLPDTQTYELLISVFCKLDCKDFATRLFEEMKENRLQPTSKIYNSLMGNFFKNFQIEGALELFREMRDLNCAPYVFTYTELIK